MPRASSSSTTLFKYAKDAHVANWQNGRANAHQDEADESSLEALQEMDAEAERLKDATAVLKNDEKALRASMRDHASLTPLPELKAAVASLQGERETLATRLTTLKEGNVKPITPEERAKVDADHEKWRKAVSARRKIRVEMWKTIEDIVGDKEKAAETKEKLGLNSL